MSIGVFRFEKNNLEAESKQLFFASVSGEDTYTRLWTKAIKDTNTKIFKADSEFTIGQVEIVLDELHNLMKWCEEKLEKNSRDYNYMQSHIKFLIKSISEEAHKGNEKFYIF